MALSLAKNGHIEAAKTIFTVLEYTYSSALTSNNLASYYEEVYYRNEKPTKRQTKHIIELYKKSLKRKDNIKAACSLGRIYFKKKQYRVSSYYYRKALKRKQKPELYYNLGLVYFYEGSYDKAIRLIKNAIRELKIEHQYEALIALIYMYSTIGTKEIARLYFHKLVSRYKEYDVDMLHLAYACEEYNYIDQNCLPMLRQWFFTVQDVEVVLTVLFGLEKEKVAKFFMRRVIEENEKCAKLTEREKLQYIMCYQTIKEFHEPKHKMGFHIDVIPHKKFYI